MIPIFLTRSYLVDRLAAGDAEARDAGKIVLYFASGHVRGKATGGMSFIKVELLLSIVPTQRDSDSVWTWSRRTGISMRAGEMCR